MEKLYADTISLYRLDQIQTADAADGKRDLGPLPRTSVILLASIAGAWVLILLYLIASRKKKN
jgi:multiple sugar transport system substrate-binding protein